jgi:1-deoxy-D-xylulose-5-phosphate synthase
MAPKDEAELRDMMATAASYNKGPIAFRYPRGVGCGANIERKPKELEIGKAEVRREGEHPSALLIGIGSTTHTCEVAAEELAKRYGVESTVVNARFVKPLDKDLLHTLIASHPLTITVEDHVLQGGFGSAVLEFMSEAGLATQTKLVRLGIDDFFVEHGSNAQLHKLCGIDANAIINAVRANSESSVFFKPRLVKKARKSALNQ